MTLADSGDTSTPTRWRRATDLFDRHSELALRSRGWNSEDAYSLLDHLGRGMLQGCPTRDFSAAWITDAETDQTRPKLHRVGTRSLARCQYVAMTHPQRSAVLVLDVDVSSHSAGGRIEDLHPQVRALLTRWAEAERGPAWIGVNPLTGKCHLLWLIDPVYAAPGTTSANTRLLAAMTNEMNRLFGGDEAFSHRLSRWPLHVSEDPTAYRWHCQHDRVNRLSDLMEITRTMTGTTSRPNREPEQQFSSGWERIEAARKATAQARALAELDAGLPSADEAAGDGSDPCLVDTRQPGTSPGKKGNLPPCRSRPDCEEFRRDAVALYESSPGASIQTIATELGVNRNTLQIWVRKYGTGARTNISASTSSSDAPTSVTNAERIRQPERENARLKEERDILRKAAKYFAEETNW